MRRATYDRTQSKGQRAAEQQARIHQAVVRAFAERPSDEVTIERVVRLAEMSKNTLYCHFPGGLEQLRALAAERHCNALTDRIARAIATSEPGQALANVVLELTRLALDNTFTLAFVMDALDEMPETRRAIAMMWMRAHNADHVLGFTPAAIDIDDAEMFVAMLQGVIGTALARPHGAEREAILSRFVAVYRRVHPFSGEAQVTRESAQLRMANAAAGAMHA